MRKMPQKRRTMFRIRSVSMQYTYVTKRGLRVQSKTCFNRCTNCPASSVSFHVADDWFCPFFFAQVDAVNVGFLAAVSQEDVRTVNRKLLFLAYCKTQNSPVTADDKRPAKLQCLYE